MKHYTYREGLPPRPRRIAYLPLDKRGYPIPYFVETLPDGTRDFRVISGRAKAHCTTRHRCWICGEKLGSKFAFVVGPMCVVTMTSAEPPSHVECAEYAVAACPFMLLRESQRRTAALPEAVHALPGHIARNPGAFALLITDRYFIKDGHTGRRLYEIRNADFLITMQHPIRDALTVRWYCQGRAATREEVMESIKSGLPALVEKANGQPLAILQIQQAVAEALVLLPAGRTQDDIDAERP